MSAKKTITALAVIAGVLAPIVPVFATSAQAGEWNRRSGGYERHRPAPHRFIPPPRHHDYAPHREHRRDRSGHAAGAAILGIGALIIGAAIADRARRDRHDYEDD